MNEEHNAKIEVYKNVVSAYQEEIKRVLAKIEKLEQPEFEFCNDGYYVSANGTYYEGIDCPLVATRGRIFKTRELAKKYEKIIDNNYKIAQAVAQLAPDYEPDWCDRREMKYWMYRDYDRREFILSSSMHCEEVGTIIFPERIKNKMLELANSGALKLEF